MTTLDLIQDQLPHLDEPDLQQVYKLIQQLSSQQHSLAEQLRTLQTICQEENYTLEISDRSDRPNPFTTIAA